MSNPLPPTGGDPPPQQPGGFPTYPQPPQPLPGYPAYPQGGIVPPAYQPQPGGYPAPSPQPGYPQYPQGPFDPNSPRLEPVKQKSNAFGRWLRIVVALVVISISYVAYSAVAHNHSTIADTAYSTAKPGPNCDTGAGQWQGGDDSSVSTSCQSNGLVITRQAGSDHVGEIFFTGANSDVTAFPQSYHVAVDAAIQSGDSNAGVGVEVHVQQKGGGHIFFARANGEWEAQISQDGGPLNNIALGFLPRATKTFHLEVTVAGPSMTFAINGKQVEALTENSISGGVAIGLALSDPQASVDATALFSNFAYTPQADPTISAGDAVATATATAQQTQRAPYRATVPGPGCDTGGGQWAPPSVLDDAVTVVKCTASGMQMTDAAGKSNLGLVGFFDRDGNFPANYSASVTIAMSQLHKGCAGLILRGDLQTGIGYNYVVCDDGSWALFTYDSSDNLTPLGGGHVKAQARYTLTASVTSGGEEMRINGNVVGQANDASLTSTGYVALALFPEQKTAPTTATFANFVFTALP